jgi:hypothetical protein
MAWISFVDFVFAWSTDFRWPLLRHRPMNTELARKIDIGIDAQRMKTWCHTRNDWLAKIFTGRGKQNFWQHSFPVNGNENICSFNSTKPKESQKVHHDGALC